MLDVGSSTLSIYPSQIETEWVLLEIFGTGSYYRSEPYLQSAERNALAAAHLARVPSGRRYKRSARSELQAKVAAKRAELATNPLSARSSGVKKDSSDCYSSIAGSSIGHAELREAGVFGLIFVMRYVPFIILLVDVVLYLYTY